MEMISVRSSAITAVGYDPTTHRMKITFQQGKTYDFCGVPAEVYQGLMSANSPGSYYDQVIRGRYEC
jgi:hypothetical protein